MPDPLGTENRVRYALTLLILLSVAACGKKEGPSRLPLQYRITGPVAGVTNCYQLDGILTWHSGDGTADLVVVGKRPAGSPKNILTTQLTKHETLEVWLMIYDIQKVTKGATAYSSLRFMVVERWDSRALEKKFWPWPETLTFHIRTSDYRIVNLE